MKFFECIKNPFSNDLVIKRYSLHTEKFKSEQSVRIVLVSDLHSNLYDNKNKKLSKWVFEQKPDIIALAGDIADSVKPIFNAIEFIKEIKDIAEIYFVFGNHECRSKEYKKIIEKLKSLNVNILENQFKKIKVNGNNLVIGGCEDPSIVKYQNIKMNWDKAFIESFKKLENINDFKVLLSHRPELVNLYKNSPFDLILSGHAHGGQVRIPYLLNGLFAPNQGFFPKYAGGLYEYNGKSHIVSRGISYDPRIPRIFNPPELVIIDVIGK